MQKSLVTQIPAALLPLSSVQAPLRAQCLEWNSGNSSLQMLVKYCVAHRPHLQCCFLRDTHLAKTTALVLCS